MAMPGRDRWLAIAVCLWAVVVIIPLLTSEQTLAPYDAIASRLSEEGGALETRSSPRSKLARNIAGMYYDDGFYYLQVARYTAAGSGSTFDGVHPTNGYHPLWLLCIVGLASMVPAPEDLLFASFGLQMLLAALTTGLVWRLARNLMGGVAATMAAVVWIRIQCTYWMSWAGMEYALQAFLVIGLLVLYSGRSGQQARRPPSARPPSASWLVQLGVVASLAFLARLDNLLLAGLLGLSLVWRERLDRRSLALFAGPVMITVAAYVAFNLWQFDHPWPVSGAVKRAWSFEALALDPLYQAHGWWVAKARYLWTPLTSLNRSHAISLLFGAFGGLVWIVAARRQIPAIGALWPVAILAVTQYLVYVAIFHGGFSFQPWYFVAQPLITALFAAWLVDRVGEMTVHRPQWRRGILAVAVSVVMISTAINTSRFRQQQARFSSEPLYVAAGWSRSHLPADTKIGSWNAGILAFFSDRQVVNLDGLVNSWSFFLDDRHDLCTYLDRERIDYVVDVFNADDPFDQYQDQIGACVSRLEMIWTGPAYPGSSPLRRAIAFRWDASSARP